MKETSLPNLRIIKWDNCGSERLPKLFDLQKPKFMGPTWVLSAPDGPHEPCYQGLPATQPFRWLLPIHPWNMHILLCFRSVMLSFGCQFLIDSCDVFSHILQGYFTYDCPSAWEVTLKNRGKNGLYKKRLPFCKHFHKHHLEGKFCISIKISLNLFIKARWSSPLFQLLAWHLTGNKPLLETMATKMSDAIWCD